MAVLALRTHHDDILGVVAPFAVISSKNTALVIDLDPEGIALPGSRSLADLVSDSPSLAELVPSRAGVACLPNGGVSRADAGEVVAALCKGWPDVVMRVRAEAGDFPLVHVVPLVPGVASCGSNTVWVRTGVRAPEGDGHVVHGPSRAAIQAALAGTTMRGRWLRSWSQVLEGRWH